MIGRWLVTMFVTSSVSLSAAASPSACGETGEALLAIIIDDLGYSHTRGRRALALPGPVTLSVIPGTPHGHELARLGALQGNELMVHMPMTSLQKPVDDPIVLTPNLTESAFELLIDHAIQSVPGAAGLNNHMGSDLTRQIDEMNQLMRRLKAWGLYFIDSRTTADTVAAKSAEQAEVPHASRSVFLDHDPAADAVRERLVAVVDIAKDRGVAIAIGHPYDVTLDVLTEQLPKLPEEVTLVPASRIVECETAQRLTSIPREAM